MQLRLQRTQRLGGLTGATVFFCLDARAEYSAEERQNIQKYKLGSQVIYNSQAARRHLESAGVHLDRTQSGSVAQRAGGLARGALSLALAKMQLTISIASLGRGHHIECKDLEELLEAEDTVRSSCKNLTRYLEVASTFNGSEVVVEYDRGEERVHVAESAPPLIEYQPQAIAVSGTAAEGALMPALAPAADLNGMASALVGRGKAAWIAVEDRLMSFATEHGLPIARPLARASCIAAGALLLTLLYEIL